MSKILFFETEDWEKEHFSNALLQDDLVFVEGKLGPDNIPAEASKAEIICVFVGSEINKEALDKLPSLKFIATRSTGFDHIDIKSAQERGIAVSNVPTYGENTAAEFTFALILVLSRKIYDAYERVREQGSFNLDGLRGFDLMGKTLGVVGTGNIGRHVVKMARGFDMNVIAFDIRQDEQFAKELGFKYVDFDKLLSESDIITLHVPYNKHTHHMLNKDNVAKIKKGAYLINTSRGAVVETDAIVEALQKGILAGAGLDVLEEEGIMQEPLSALLGGHPNAEQLKIAMKNHYLIDHPNVIITPHNAFNTREAIVRILDTTVANINSWKKKNPINIVEFKK